MNKLALSIIITCFFIMLMSLQLSADSNEDYVDLTTENQIEACDENVGFSLNIASAFAQDTDPGEEGDCHKTGDCETICGSGYTACSYMDCGSGTQLCHKN